MSFKRILIAVDDSEFMARAADVGENRDRSHQPQPSSRHAYSQTATSSFGFRVCPALRRRRS
jgi:hypothetical protein